MSFFMSDAAAEESEEVSQDDDEEEDLLPGMPQTRVQAASTEGVDQAVIAGLKEQIVQAKDGRKDAAGKRDMDTAAAWQARYLGLEEALVSFYAIVACRVIRLHVTTKLKCAAFPP